MKKTDLNSGQEFDENFIFGTRIFEEVVRASVRAFCSIHHRSWIRAEVVMAEDEVVGLIVENPFRYTKPGGL